jgi:hypothetical protein
MAKKLHKSQLSSVKTNIFKSGVFVYKFFSEGMKPAQEAGKDKRKNPDRAAAVEDTAADLTKEKTPEQKRMDAAVTAILTAKEGSTVNLPDGLTDKQTALLYKIAGDKVVLNNDPKIEVHSARFETAAMTERPPQTIINDLSSALDNNNAKKLQNTITELFATVGKSKVRAKYIREAYRILADATITTENVDTVIVGTKTFNRQISSLATDIGSTQDLGEAAQTLARLNPKITEAQVRKIASHFKTEYQIFGNRFEIVLNNATVGRGNTFKTKVTISIYKGGNGSTKHIGENGREQTRIFSAVHTTDIINKLNISLPTFPKPEGYVPPTAPEKNKEITDSDKARDRKKETLKPAGSIKEALDRLGRDYHYTIKGNQDAVIIGSGIANDMAETQKTLNANEAKHHGKDKVGFLTAKGITAEYILKLIKNDTYRNELKKHRPHPKRIFLIGLAENSIQTNKDIAKTIKDYRDLISHFQSIWPGVKVVVPYAKIEGSTAKKLALQKFNKEMFDDSSEGYGEGYGVMNNFHKSDTSETREDRDRRFLEQILPKKEKPAERAELHKFTGDITKITGIKTTVYTNPSHAEPLMPSDLDTAKAKITQMWEDSGAKGKLDPNKHRLNIKKDQYGLQIWIKRGKGTFWLLSKIPDMEKDVKQGTETLRKLVNPDKPEALDVRPDAKEGGEAPLQQTLESLELPRHYFTLRSGQPIFVIGSSIGNGIGDAQDRLRSNADRLLYGENQLGLLSVKNYDAADMLKLITKLKPHLKKIDGPRRISLVGLATNSIHKRGDLEKSIKDHQQLIYKLREIWPHTEVEVVEVHTYGNNKGRNQAIREFNNAMREKYQFREAISHNEKGAHFNSTGYSRLLKIVGHLEIPATNAEIAALEQKVQNISGLNNVFVSSKPKRGHFTLTKKDIEKLTSTVDKLWSQAEPNQLNDEKYRIIIYKGDYGGLDISVYQKEPASMEACLFRQRDPGKTDTATGAQRLQELAEENTKDVKPDRAETGAPAPETVDQLATDAEHNSLERALENLTGLNAMLPDTVDGDEIPLKKSDVAKLEKTVKQIWEKAAPDNVLDPNKYDLYIYNKPDEGVSIAISEGGPTLFTEKGDYKQTDTTTGANRLRDYVKSLGKVDKRETDDEAVETPTTKLLRNKLSEEGNISVDPETATNPLGLIKISTPHGRYNIEYQTTKDIVRIRIKNDTDEVLKQITLPKPQTDEQITRKITDYLNRRHLDLLKNLSKDENPYKTGESAQTDWAPKRFTHEWVTAESSDREVISKNLARAEGYDHAAEKFKKLRISDEFNTSRKLAELFTRDARTNASNETTFDDFIEHFSPMPTLKLELNEAEFGSIDMIAHANDGIDQDYIVYLDLNKIGEDTEYGLELSEKPQNFYALIDLLTKPNSQKSLPELAYANAIERALKKEGMSTSSLLQRYQETLDAWKAITEMREPEAGFKDNEADRIALAKQDFAAQDHAKIETLISTFQTAEGKKGAWDKFTAWFAGKRTSVADSTLADNQDYLYQNMLELYGDPISIVMEMIYDHENSSWEGETKFLNETRIVNKLNEYLVLGTFFEYTQRKLAGGKETTIKNPVQIKNISDLNNLSHEEKMILISGVVSKETEENYKQEAEFYTDGKGAPELHNLLSQLSPAVLPPEDYEKIVGIANGINVKIGPKGPYNGGGLGVDHEINDNGDTINFTVGLEKINKLAGYAVVGYSAVMKDKEGNVIGTANTNFIVQNIDLTNGLDVGMAESLSLATETDDGIIVSVNLGAGFGSLGMQVSMGLGIDGAKYTLRKDIQAKTEELRKKVTPKVEEMWKMIENLKGEKNTSEQITFLKANLPGIEEYMQKHGISNEHMLRMTQMALSEVNREEIFELAKSFFIQGYDFNFEVILLGAFTGGIGLTAGVRFKLGETETATPEQEYGRRMYTEKALGTQAVELAKAVKMFKDYTASGGRFERTERTSTSKYASLLGANRKQADLLKSANARLAEARSEEPETLETKLEDRLSKIDHLDVRTQMVNGRETTIVKFKQHYSDRKVILDPALRDKTLIYPVGDEIHIIGEMPEVHYLENQYHRKFETDRTSGESYLVFGSPENIKSPTAIVQTAPEYFEMHANESEFRYERSVGIHDESRAVGMVLLDDKNRERTLNYFDNLQKTQRQRLEKQTSLSQPEKINFHESNVEMLKATAMFREKAQSSLALTTAEVKTVEATWNKPEFKRFFRRNLSHPYAIRNEFEKLNPGFDRQKLEQVSEIFIQKYFINIDRHAEKGKAALIKAVEGIKKHSQETFEIRFEIALNNILGTKTERQAKAKELAQLYVAKVYDPLIDKLKKTPDNVKALKAALASRESSIAEGMIFSSATRQEIVDKNGKDVGTDIGLYRTIASGKGEQFIKGTIHRFNHSRVKPGSDEELLLKVITEMNDPRPSHYYEIVKSDLATKMLGHTVEINGVDYSVYHLITQSETGFKFSKNHSQELAAALTELKNALDTKNRTALEKLSGNKALREFIQFLSYYRNNYEFVNTQLRITAKAENITGTMRARLEATIGAFRICTNGSAGLETGTKIDLSQETTEVQERDRTSYGKTLGRAQLSKAIARARVNMAIMSRGGGSTEKPPPDNSQPSKVPPEATNAGGL